VGAPGQTQTEAAEEQNQQLTEAAPKPASWMRRLGTIIYALFSFEIGFLLVRAVWSEAWTQNSFFVGYPEVRDWMNEGFVRGAVTGLGLLCIWGALSTIGWIGRRRP
jgi:hypothetical protein